MKDTCRTCRFLDVPARKDGKRVAIKGSAYRCKAPIPDLSAFLPTSVTRSYGWQQPKGKCNAFPEWIGCPLHQPKEPSNADQ
jgi:hypothetical protein